MLAAHYHIAHAPSIATLRTTEPSIRFSLLGALQRQPTHGNWGRAYYQSKKTKKKQEGKTAKIGNPQLLTSDSQRHVRAGMSQVLKPCHSSRSKPL